jgi:hypothetical protein
MQELGCYDRIPWAKMWAMNSAIFSSRVILADIPQRKETHG